MPAKVGQLELDFLLNLSQFQSDLQKAEKATEKAAKQMQATMSNAMKGIAASVATIGVGVAFTELSKNIDEAESSIAQVNATIKSTGGAAKVTAKDVEDLSQSIKKMTGVDDDAVRSMQSVLLTFTKVGKEVFPEAARAIVDLSVKMKQDLQSSAVQVGKALNDPIKGITALTRVGVSFTESQKALVKHLEETGHHLDAQKILLRELKTEFGGAAAAARDTLGGAMKALEVSVGDVWQAIGTGKVGGGLRTAVEMLNIGLEQTVTVISDMQDPSTKLGKQFGVVDKAVKTVNDALSTFSDYLNIAIYAADVGAKALGKGFEELANNPTIAKWSKGLGDAFNKMGADFENANKNIKAAIKGGVIPDHFKWIKDLATEATKRINDMHAAAAKNKGPAGGSPADVEMKSKKEIDALARQRKTLDDILRTYELKNEAVGKLTIEQKALNEQIEAERRISALTNIPFRERLAAINQIAAATKERVRLEKESKISEQRDTLKEMLEHMQTELKLGKNKKDDQEELNILVNAEAELRKATKDYAGENLELQNEILDAAREQVEAAKQIKHDAALKTLKEITQEYDDELQALQDQIAGTENLNKLRKETQKINEIKGLNDDEKSAAIQHITEVTKKTKELNKAQAASEKLIDDIASAESSHVEKVKALRQAYEDKQVSEKQFADGLNKIASSSDKAKNAAASFASTITNGLSNIFSGGTKVTDVFKSMGQELLKLGAKAFFLDPIEKFITNSATKMFGGPSAVGTLPPGVTRDPSGKYSYSADGSNASSYWPSNLPNKSGAAGRMPGSPFPLVNSGILGGVLGGAVGAGGLLSQGAAGRGVSNVGSVNANTPQGFFSVLKELIQSGGHIPDPKTPVDNNQLFDQWEYLKKNGGKDANGNNLEDFEYYQNRLNRMEAQNKLGMINDKKAGFGDILGMLTGQGTGNSAMSIFKSILGGTSPVTSGGAGAGSFLANLFGMGKKPAASTAWNPLLGDSAIAGMPGALSMGPGSPVATQKIEMVDLLKSIDANIAKMVGKNLPMESTAPRMADELWSGSTEQVLEDHLKGQTSSNTTGILSPLMGGAVGASGILSTGPNAPVEKVKQATTTGVTSLFNNITTSIKTGFSQITSPISGIVNQLFGGGSMGGMLSALTGGLSSLVGGLTRSLTSGLSGLLGPIGGIVGSLFGGGGANSNGSTIFSGIGKAMGQLGGSLKGSIASWLPGGGNKSNMTYTTGSDGMMMGNFNGLRGYGSGGWYAPNQPFVAGEHGREIIYPGAQGGYVQSSAQSDPYIAEIEQLLQQQRDMGDAYGPRWNNYTNMAINTKLGELYKRQGDIQNNGLAQQLRQIIDQDAMNQARERNARKRAEQDFRYLGSVDEWLDNERMQHGMTNGVGNVGMAGGDQAVNMLLEAQARGTYVSDDMFRYAGRQDYFWKTGYANISEDSTAHWKHWLTNDYKSQGITGGTTYTDSFVQPEDYTVAQAIAWANKKSKGSPLGSYIGGDRSGGNITNYNPGPGDWMTTDGSQRLRIDPKTGWIDGLDGDYFPGGRNHADDQLEYLSPEYYRKKLQESMPKPHYEPGSEMSGMVQYWRNQGYTKAQIDQLITMNGGTLPPTASVPDRWDTLKEQGKATDYYKKLTGGTSNPELGTISSFKQYADKLLRESNSRFTGSQMNGSGSTGDGGLNSNRGASSIYGNGGTYTGGMLDSMIGGAVGAPGKLSTSRGAVNVSINGDVFAEGSKGNYNRMDNSGLLDGMIAGKLGIGTGRDSAVSGVPHGGWAYGGPRANGGHVDKNTMYKVLERGDEMFIPDTAGQILPLNRGMVGGSAPNIQIINQAGVNVEQSSSNNGRDVGFLITSKVAEDNVTGVGARTLQTVYGLQKQTTRRG